MINLALVAVLAVVVLLLLYLFFMNRRAVRLRAVAREVEAEVATKLRRKEGVASDVIDQLATGTPTDQVITGYQSDRATILTLDRTEKPWAWDKDDLDRWRKRELARRSEDANRKLIVPALASSLVVLAIAAVAITICYNSLAPQEFQAVSVQAMESQPALPAPLPLDPSPPSVPALTPPVSQALSPNSAQPDKPTTSPNSNDIDPPKSPLPNPMSAPISDDAPERAHQ